MNILALLIKILPVVVQLMGLAEKVFANKPQSGADKKAAVMEATNTLINATDTVLTGGAAETWAGIKAPVSVMIDAAAAIMWPKVDVNDPKYSTGA